VNISWTQKFRENVLIEYNGNLKMRSSGIQSHTLQYFLLTSLTSDTRCFCVLKLHSFAHTVCNLWQYSELLAWVHSSAFSQDQSSCWSQSTSIDMYWIYHTKCHCQVVSAPASHLGGPRFKSLSINWLSWLWSLWFSPVPPVRYQDSILN
jgi:hypothetical protein